MLEVKRLYAGYDRDDVIREISFSVGKGECFCVLGPNGCGKSTLLKSIARLIDYRGLVSIEGLDITSFSRMELARKIALLSQDAQVFFPYTVYETVSMGRYPYSGGLFKSLSAADEEITESVMRKLDVAGISGRMIDKLSGGQLQRVFLARALVQTPEVILLDEPTSHLDLKYQVELLAFLKTWAKENGKAVVGVFHDLNLARRFGDTAILMQDGSIAAAGKIEDVLKSDTLHAVYGIDIHAFMLESLGQWEG